jgi:hypothetical protein
VEDLWSFSFFLIFFRYNDFFFPSQWVRIMLSKRKNGFCEFHIICVVKIFVVYCIRELGVTMETENLGLLETSMNLLLV